MANRPDQHDRQEESQLEQLLKTSYGNTPPSDEFQATLLDQLDEEYQRTYLSSAAAGKLDAQPGSQRQNNRPRRLIGLRLAVSMAVAASLLLIVTLWNSQNAFGWAAMLRALENCGWVQADAESAGLSGWVSSQRGVLAIRSGEKVAYFDHSAQTSAQYSADKQVIDQQTMAANSGSLDVGKQLLSWLLADVTGSASEQRLSYEVLSESWRRVGENDQDVELLVTLRSSDAQRNTYKIRAILNAETQLPTSVELLSREQGESKKVLVLEYPSEGPSSIYALGVPRETEVVASPSTVGEELRVARDTESARVFGTGAPATQEREVARLAVRPALDAREVNESSEQLANGKLDTQVGVEKKTDDLEADLLAAPKKQAIDNQNLGLAKEFVKPATGDRVVADEIVTPQPEAPLTAESSEDQPPAERLAAATPTQTDALPQVDFTKPALSLAAVVEQLNNQLADHWEQQGITVAEPATDTEFLRRVYLDLTGRIPVPFEVYEYLEADPQTRREQLVDQLLESRDHATHLATVWRKLLLPDAVDTNIYGGTGKFDEWLADRFEQNLPYDELVEQLLLAEGRVSDSGPILFYAALKLNPEELAAKTARTFLGMRMECAQCHDHPFDDSISQDDFWGFAAHFAQISRPKGKIEMTSSVLRVRDNDRGEVMMPDTEDVVPPQLPYDIAIRTDQTAEGDQKSRRQQLVEWLTTKQNSRFARATVNRVWQHLFGLGLVEPADDMRADNMPTCPEVLDNLSHDFAAHDYDLRRLLRTLVLSDAYQLSSRAKADEPSQSLEFARMNIKSFTADQLYDCINVATEPSLGGGQEGDGGSLVRFGNAARQAFIQQFKAPPGQRTDYQAGIPQALTLMHGQLVHGATDLATSGLLKGINAPFYSGDDERIETLFLATLSRFPDESELEAMLNHVKAAEDDEGRLRAFGDVLWALLNSAEFTFIH